MKCFQFAQQEPRHRIDESARTHNNQVDAVQTAHMRHLMAYSHIAVQFSLLVGHDDVVHPVERSEQVLMHRQAYPSAKTIATAGTQETFHLHRGPHPSAEDYQHIHQVDAYKQISPHGRFIFRFSAIVRNIRYCSSFSIRHYSRTS